MQWMCIVRLYSNWLEDSFGKDLAFTSWVLLHALVLLEVLIVTALCLGKGYTRFLIGPMKGEETPAKLGSN
jgi:hypothetical protein